MRSIKGDTNTDSFSMSPAISLIDFARQVEGDFLEVVVMCMFMSYLSLLEFVIEEAGAGSDRGNGDCEKCRR